MLTAHPLPIHPRPPLQVSCAACGGGVSFPPLLPAATFPRDARHWYPEIRPTTVQVRHPLRRWHSAATENRIRRGNAVAPANGTVVVRRVARSVAASARSLSSPHPGGAEWPAAPSVLPIPRPSPHALHLSLIHISEPTRLGMISYAVFCLK